MQSEAGIAQQTLLLGYPYSGFTELLLQFL